MVNAILTNNIYGVDINAESVEITKLALWMHTASPNKPLSSLNDRMRCGNSLVGPDFYNQRQPDLFTTEEKERINVFDWKEAFPGVFAQGGFDCVIGNPPYVKLQHFRRLHSDMAEYLNQTKRADGSPLYESTQTGNFDLYLPFIEKGMELLNSHGRMGYIAPNMWMKNEYGQGLRNKLKRTRQLDRWLDFRSYQVFAEASTYTALQFFKGSGTDAVRCIIAPDGDISRINWNTPDGTIPWEKLPRDEAWNFMSDSERFLVKRLGQTCSSLAEFSEGITVGIQTSADHLYHLTRLAPGRYKTKSGEEICLEDEIMHPLVSGEHVKRYQDPKTDTWLLFPYDLSTDPPRLFSPETMASKYPLAWRYLKSYEETLRAREGRKFDHDSWYRFGRHQNIDKQ